LSIWCFSTPLLVSLTKNRHSLPKSLGHILFYRCREANVIFTLI
jgi:hypothetical protein